jgi:cyanobactin maturation PatA/PatG family protease
MDLRSVLPGLQSLQQDTLGDPSISVAVLDGPVDLAHPCFAGADLQRVDTLVQEPAGPGRMSAHGTHVASLIFGQPDTQVVGIAPLCRGLIVPVFRDFQEGHLPQLDLARAIEQAVQLGADVISVSGGERAPDGQADSMLDRALRRCNESNVLVVAAAGNDGCDCLHVPAAASSVLAAGALGRDGHPLAMSNWGEAYRSHGVLAPGEDIPGAAPGGGTTGRTGSSFATPLVAGVAALLMSIQRRTRNRVDARTIAKAIVETAVACHPSDAPECRRYLAGVLNIPGAHAQIRKGGDTTVADLDSAHTPARVAELPPGQAGPGTVAAQEAGLRAAGSEAPAGTTASIPGTGDVRVAAAAAPAAAAGFGAPSATCHGSGVSSSEGCNCQNSSADAATAAATAATAAVTAVAVATPSLVYALGTVGFDFGTEARRDTFRQNMPSVVRDEDGTDVQVTANPYDVFQLTDYLNSRPSESTKLIWTLNLDLTPIYALEAELAYPEEVYATLRDALRRGGLPGDNANHVSRVSIPGVMANRTVRLFSGQLVPLVVVQPRGLFEWNEPSLVDAVVDAVMPRADNIDRNRVSKLVRIFLDKVYFECRNLGLAPGDRALNFAATNAFQFASGILNGFLSGELVPGGENSIYTLDTIDVVRSPYCRLGSDCYDVTVRWFDPENERRAKSVFMFTIDVSDVQPATIAPAHQYLTT